MTTTETAAPSRLSDTLGRMLRERRPNLFRLYLNPFVTQACFCLDRYVRSTWTARADAPDDPYPSFLANSFDEALGGAIKLARYCLTRAGKSTDGLVLDFEDRVGSFTEIELSDGGRIELIPGLKVVKNARDLADVGQKFGLVVLASGLTDESFECVERLVRRDEALLVMRVTRQSLAELRRGDSPALARLRPDMVVFDESFVNREVPFGAFSARGVLYDHWKGAGRANFHSTTYQPNTVSSLHFMNCLAQADPEFFASVAADLQRIEADFDYRKALFGRLYSTSLRKAIRQTGCDTPDIRAEGDFVIVNGQPIFDGVSGVACSVRGHNPPDYLHEIESSAWTDDPAAELAGRLGELTGLPHLLPAVSGATAVENALKLALAAQYPRRDVIALRSGFGGKTLLSLAGTWRSFYKENIGPLYGDVSYVDPFAENAIAQFEAAMSANPAAVVQVELVQGVGGVRAVPENVLRHLAESRERHGHLLLVDEVQTGMYRTGPFARSVWMRLEPDLLTIGKGTSDMMFPFALTLYSEAVAAQVNRAAPGLADELGHRYGYEQGYRTVLNVLKQAEQLNLEQRVRESAELVAADLRESLSGCRAVRDIRVFGMLIGIELDDSRWPQRWLHKRLFWFYLAAMLRHPQFPVLVGFCQYEPNVLKITPPLSADPEHLRKACRTITEVLTAPFPKLAAAVIKNRLRPCPIKRRDF
jgi:acetylornithine/succinyldiaminopimelate/putrescine aminotransferase